MKKTTRVKKKAGHAEVGGGRGGRVGVGRWVAVVGRVVGGVRGCFVRYWVFRGRAGRGEFWWFWGVVVLVDLGLGWVECAGLGWGCGGGGGYRWLSLMWFLGVLVPGLAVGARRLHDVGVSGGWLLLCIPYCLTVLMEMLSGGYRTLEQVEDTVILYLTAFVLLIPFLTMACMRGERVGNKYGEPLV